MTKNVGRVWIKWQNQNKCSPGGGQNLQSSFLTRDIKEFNVIILILIGILLVSLAGVSSLALFSGESIGTENISGKVVKNTISTLDKSGANAPVIEDNMIPIYYSETDSNWHKADVTNNDLNNQWYDYDKKMWANAATIYNEPDYYTKKITEKEVSFEKNITVTDGYIIENKNVSNGSDFSRNASFTFTTGDTGGEFSFDYFVTDPSINSFSITVEGISISDCSFIDPLVSGSYFITVKPNTTYKIGVGYYGDPAMSPNGYAVIGDFVLPDNLSKDFTFTSTGSPSFVKTTKEVVGPSRMVYSNNSFDYELGYYLSNPTADLSVGKFICADFFSAEKCKVMYEIKEVTGNMITKANVYEKQTMREYYQSAPVGTVIPMNNINAMFVWIPRYKYTYFKGQTKCSSLTNPTIETNPECYEYVYQDRFYDTLYNHIMGDYDNATIAESVLNSWKNGEKDRYYRVTFEEFVKPENGNIGGDFSTFFGDYSAAKSPVEIKINFEKGTASTGTIKCVDKIVYNGTNTGNTSEVCTDTTNGGLVVGKSTYTHPAFTFGGDELPGIWVGKFESVGSEAQTIVPNVSPYDFGVYTFSSVRKMEGPKNAYGFPQDGTAYNTTGEITGDSNNLDIHVAKNTEWGAVAYFSHSKYGTCTDGICKEIGINNYILNNTSRTGCGAEAGSTRSETCNVYNTVEGMKASTTRNVYGIYDMSGGENDQVAVFVANSSNQFSTTLLEKYYDKYTHGKNVEFTRGKLGDAMVEMLLSINIDGDVFSWYDDSVVFLYGNSSKLFRGNDYYQNKNAGIFGSYFESSTVNSLRGNRIVLTINP